MRHFADSYTSLNSLQPVEFAPDTLGYLASLPFMGNVRELKNLVERTILINGNSRLLPADFEAHYNGETMCGDEVNTQGLTLDEIEKLTIKSAMSKYDGNLTQVALSLGISRQSLYRRMEKYGLKY